MAFLLSVLIKLGVGRTVEIFVFVDCRSAYTYIHSSVTEHSLCLPALFHSFFFLYFFWITITWLDFSFTDKKRPIWSFSFNSFILHLQYLPPQNVFWELKLKKSKTVYLRLLIKRKENYDISTCENGAIKRLLLQHMYVISFWIAIICNQRQVHCKSIQLSYILCLFV
jgi:hypothetical protein